MKQMTRRELFGGVIAATGAVAAFPIMICEAGPLPVPNGQFIPYCFGNDPIATWPMEMMSNFAMHVGCLPVKWNIIQKEDDFSFVEMHFYPRPADISKDNHLSVAAMEYPGVFIAFGNCLIDYSIIQKFMEQCEMLKLLVQHTELIQDNFEWSVFKIKFAAIHKNVSPPDSDWGQAVLPPYGYTAMGFK